MPPDYLDTTLPTASLRLSTKADRDLEEAVAFLAAKSPAAGERLGLGLVDTIFELVDLPHKGAPLLARPGYRRVLHRPWHLIFCRVDESAGIVEIVRIWDGRKNPKKSDILTVTVTTHGGTALPPTKLRR